MVNQKIVLGGKTEIVKPEFKSKLHFDSWLPPAADLTSQSRFSHPNEKDKPPQKLGRLR